MLFVMPCKNYRRLCRRLALQFMDSLVDNHLAGNLPGDNRVPVERKVLLKVNFARYKH